MTNLAPLMETWPVGLVAVAVSVLLTVRVVVWIKAIRDNGPTPHNGVAVKRLTAERRAEWRTRMEGLATGQQRLTEQIAEQLAASNQVQAELLRWIKDHHNGAEKRGEVLADTHRLVREIHEQRRQP